jgi:hypothetical protein
VQCGSWRVRLYQPASHGPSGTYVLLQALRCNLATGLLAMPGASFLRYYTEAEGKDKQHRALCFLLPLTRPFAGSALNYT